MIQIKAAEFAQILEAYAHELSSDSGDILREDLHVTECLELISNIARKTNGLTARLQKEASLFCLTFDDVCRRPIGE